MNQEIVRRQQQLAQLRRELQQMAMAEDPELWVSIPHNDLVKRAIEVAAVQRHSVAIFGREMAERLSLAAAQLGVAAFAIKWCPCGNFGSLASPCSCSVDAFERYKAGADWQRMLGCDLIVEAIEHAPNGRTPKGEDIKDVQARVERARQTPVPPYVESDDMRAMMRLAVSELNLDIFRVERIQQVSRSIAALGGDKQVQVHALMEAIQYMSHPVVR
jgi:hypothetical protein